LTAIKEATSTQLILWYKEYDLDYKDKGIEELRAGLRAHVLTHEVKFSHSFDCQAPSYLPFIPTKSDGTT
jgi:hypothetical protein